MTPLSLPERLAAALPVLSTPMTQPKRPQNADAIVRHLTGMLYSVESDIDELRKLWPDPACTNSQRAKVFSRWGELKSKLVGTIQHINSDHERRG